MRLELLKHKHILDTHYQNSNFSGKKIQKIKNKPSTSKKWGNQNQPL
jgi:hypothetical protein